MKSVSGNSMGWQWHAGGGAALKTLMGFNVSRHAMGCHAFFYEERFPLIAFRVLEFSCSCKTVFTEEGVTTPNEVKSIEYNFVYNSNQ